jgi:hypothetical protein
MIPNIQRQPVANMMTVSKGAAIAVPRVEEQLNTRFLRFPAHVPRHSRKYQPTAAMKANLH